MGLRGYVLDTKFGPRYDVKKPLVLTRIRQDISAGKCVAGMISPPRQHTSCSSEVFSASASIVNLHHRARIPWIVEHPCDSCLWEVLKNRLLRLSLARPGPWQIYENLDHRAENEELAPNCSHICGTGGRCSVTGQKLSIPKNHHHSQRVILRVTTPALSVDLSRSP